MYAEQWEEYRKRRRIFLSVLLGCFLPFVYCILLFKVLPDEEIVNRVYLAMFATWGLVLSWAWIRLQYWRCPRCDNYYFRGLSLNPFVRRCLHCGLKKWDEGETEKDEQFYSK
jgi:hypothetical protein